MVSVGFERTEERFSQLDDRLDVREELDMYRRKFEKIEEALHIKL